MINEIVPSHPEEDFYGKSDAAYMTTTIPLFKNAGIEVDSCLLYTSDAADEFISV